MSQVFISYAHKNDKFVAVLKKQLLDAGFEPMIDTDFLRAGEDWRLEIDTSIRNSLALIAVMSPDAFQSKYVTYEWAFALGLGIKVIPLMLEKTDLHPRLDTLQYISFDEHFNLDQSWQKLLARLKQIESEYKSPQKTLVNHAELASLLGDLQSPYTKEVNIAVSGLAAIGKPAIPGLLFALDDGSPYVRRAVATTLGLIGGDSIVTDLEDRLYVESDSDVIRSILKALTRIGTLRANTVIERWEEYQSNKPNESSTSVDDIPF